MQEGVRRSATPVELRPGGSQLASTQRVADHYGRSRWWALELLKEWYAEQQLGGPPRVLKRGRIFYTTLAVLHAHAPRGRDEQLQRKLRQMENDIEKAFVRIAELERRLGRRR